MDDFALGWIAGFFEGRGSFCRTGSGNTFAMEAFSKHRVQLERMRKMAGGHVYPPPPSAPSRWIWRLYGAQAEVLYEKIRSHLSAGLVARGDKKLGECYQWLAN